MKQKMFDFSSSKQMSDTKRSTSRPRKMKSRRSIENFSITNKSKGKKLRNPKLTTACSIELSAPFGGFDLDAQQADTTEHLYTQAESRYVGDEQANMDTYGEYEHSQSQFSLPTKYH